MYIMKDYLIKRINTLFMMNKIKGLKYITKTINFTVAQGTIKRW